MEAWFFCTDCGAEHTEPAEAFLGHLILCLDCDMRRGFEGGADGVFAVGSPIAAENANELCAVGSPIAAENADELCAVSSPIAA